MTQQLVVFSRLLMRKCRRTTSPVILQTCNLPQSVPYMLRLILAPKVSASHFTHSPIHCVSSSSQPSPSRLSVVLSFTSDDFPFSNLHHSTLVGLTTPGQGWYPEGGSVTNRQRVKGSSEPNSFISLIDSWDSNQGWTLLLDVPPTGGR